MKNKYTCPPDFDISTSSLYSISQSWKKEYARAECDNIEFLCLTTDTPQYYLASGQIWKQVPFEHKIEFEIVHHPRKVEDQENIYYHTEFIIEDDKIHIDYVLSWGSGPGSRHDNVKIYVNNKTKACGIVGGSSFGLNWRNKHPAKPLHRNFLLIFESQFSTPVQRTCLLYTTMLPGLFS